MTVSFLSPTDVNSHNLCVGHGWIVKSHIRWREELSKGVGTFLRFKILKLTTNRNESKPTSLSCYKTTTNIIQIKIKR